MNLAGQNLLNTLDPNRHYLPIWGLDIARDHQVKIVVQWEGHNLGRWWDAMLRLEAATGFDIPAEIEGAMLQNLQAYFDNPEHICLAPSKKGRSLDMHSLREGLLALNALVRYRNSRWAVRQGHQMLDTLRRRTREDLSLDFQETEYLKDTDNDAVRRVFPPVDMSAGRLIEALTWFYEATKNELAFDLASRYSRFFLEHMTYEDGSLNRSNNPTHTHSYLGTLRGLLLFGEMIGDRTFIDRVEATYRVTVRRMIKRSGYADHDLESREHGGETTSPGDAAQLALWLANQGYPEYLDDVERIVRARIVPSQLTDCPPLRAAVEGSSVSPDRLRTLALGAFGGQHYELHAGKRPTTDITAADVHSLCDIYTHTIADTPAGLAVYLHFDYENEWIQVQSQRAERAIVTVRPRIWRPVMVRVPEWAPRDSVTLSVDGQPIEPIWVGSFVRVSPARRPQEIVLAFDTPERTEKEEIWGEVFTVKWRGDEIIGISPNSCYLPYYPTLELSHGTGDGEYHM
jgi:hypothetical protein